MSPSMVSVGFQPPLFPPKKMRLQSPQSRILSGIPDRFGVRLGEPLHIQMHAVTDWQIIITLQPMNTNQAKRFCSHFVTSFPRQSRKLAPRQIGFQSQCDETQIASNGECSPCYSSHCWNLSTSHLLHACFSICQPACPLQSPPALFFSFCWTTNAW